MVRTDLRNVAIIAHVDHGKTTLVDGLLHQGGIFRDNQAVSDRVMDSNDLERERGITILAKNTAVNYKGTKINIIDTPGHADFGGEVERVLKMVNGVLLLVDAFEGPMPQTRFVLEKALSLGHKIIIVVNKVDRPDARVQEVVDEILELFMDLNATDEQLDSPVVYCSARAGISSRDPENMEDNLIPLFETIISHIDPPSGNEDEPLQVLVSSIDYNEYVGRIAIGKIERGKIEANTDVMVCDWNQSKTPYKSKIINIYQFEGLKRSPVTQATVGDVICFSGIENITIGETVCSPLDVTPLPFVKISEPTVEMTFSVNDSPFAGREGKFVTSRQLRERLFRELLKDVSLRVYETDSTDNFRVLGRGEMHLSILIETMRREGYEFQVSSPKVLYKTINDTLCEPIESLVVDVPEESVGIIMQKIGARKGEFVNMTPVGSRMRLEFHVPSRGLFGYRGEFMTDTRGEGILSTVFFEYEPYKGELPTRATGSLIAFESGESVTYGLFNAQERGELFIEAGIPVYEGMVVGESPKNIDIAVNVCKKKHATNMRASGTDEALRLVPPKKMSLEKSIEFIKEDELLEITPLNIRIRKKILNNSLRLKAASKVGE
ncbi:MAG: translational GTPase TypA [Clostridiales bacterium]|nr:translational GTPase TypA [Clostridiales bacterium]